MYSLRVISDVHIHMGNQQDGAKCNRSHAERCVCVCVWGDLHAVDIYALYIYVYMRTGTSLAGGLTRGRRLSKRYGRTMGRMIVWLCWLVSRRRLEIDCIYIYAAISDVVWCCDWGIVMLMCIDSVWFRDDFSRERMARFILLLFFGLFIIYIFKLEFVS